MTIRKQNFAGYYDEQGRFRPIRSPQFVGTPKRKATARDKKKYSRAKAGDLGKKKQSRALEDVFDREIRLAGEREAAKKREQEKILRDIERDIYGGGETKGKGQTLMQYVRSKGGIRRTKNDIEEVNRLSFKETGKRGLATDKGGKTLDAMFQLSREAGYDVADMWDMVAAIENEAKHGKATYVTHGYMDYRDNPKSDLYIGKLGTRSYGVFLKTYLLKKFATKVAAEKYLGSIRSRAKNPVTAAKLAKAAIGVFDTDFDLDLDTRDVKRLQQGAKRISKTSAKKPSRSRAKKNPRSPFKWRTVSGWGVKYYVLENKDGLTVGMVEPSSGNRYLVVPAVGFREQFFTTLRAAKDEAEFQATERHKKNPIEPVTALATGLSSIVSALTIKKMLAEDEQKKLMKRKTPVRRKSNGTTSAKRRMAVKNPLTKYARKEPTTDSYAVNKMDTVFYSDSAGREPYMRMPWHQSGHPTRRSKTVVLNTFRWNLKWLSPIKKARKNPSTSKASNEREFNSALAAIKKGEYAKARTAKTRGRLAGYSAREVDLLISNAKLTGRLATKLSSNPPKRKTTTVRKKAVARSAKKKNPVKAPRRRTFEMFQGRKVTDVKAMPVSQFAPAKLDQLGDLIELKLADGQILKLNPQRFKLCAAGGKLWIAGGKFAKQNPASRTNELNAIERIEHVVYGTYKPHHGDNNYTHYIHKLGEESGHLPMLAVDREGFPVIRGGKYKIEARGIVN